MKITTTFGPLLCCSVLVLALAACGGNKAETAPPTSPTSPPPTPAAGNGEDHHGKKSTSSGPIKPPGEANVGDTSKCPVSGEEFDVTATSPKAEHDGKTYYFCCGGCKKKFEANPAGFLHKT